MFCQAKSQALTLPSYTWYNSFPVSGTLDVLYHEEEAVWLQSLGCA